MIKAFYGKHFKLLKKVIADVIVSFFPCPSYSSEEWGSSAETVAVFSVSHSLSRGYDLPTGSLSKRLLWKCFFLSWKSDICFKLQTKVTVNVC